MYRGIKFQRLSRRIISNKGVFINKVSIVLCHFQQIKFLTQISRTKSNRKMTPLVRETLLTELP